MLSNKFGVIKIRHKTSYEILVILFFLTMHIDYMEKTNLTLLLRYFVSILCFAIPLLKKKIKLSMNLIIISVLIGTTGILNIYIIGNTTIFKIIYTIMSFYIACFFLCNEVESKPFLISTYINAILIFLKYISKGSMSSIYANASGNYVSIMLLFSLTIYYVKCETQKKDFTVIPAVIVFILCIIAVGRGGILSSGILLITVLIIKASTIGKGKTSIFLKLLIMLIVIFCIAIYIPSFMQSDSYERFFGRFDSLGLSDHGRFYIWEQYLNKVNESKSYLLLGAPLNEIPIVVYHEGNLHNSYLNIHAFNGIILFISVAILFIKSAANGVSKKRWVFLSCMLIIVLRGYTDQMLWGTIGTPIFAFYLLYNDNNIDPKTGNSD